MASRQSASAAVTTSFDAREVCSGGISECTSLEDLPFGVLATERTREIGVRKAIGARKSAIQMQFLIEAVLLSCAGGAIGIALGYLASDQLAQRAGWQMLVSTDVVALAFGFSAFIGIVFGFYPARRASLLDPIEALRYD